MRERENRLIIRKLKSFAFTYMCNYIIKTWAICDEFSLVLMVYIFKFLHLLFSHFASLRICLNHIFVNEKEKKNEKR